MITLPNALHPAAGADWLEISLISRPGATARISDTAILDTFEEADARDPEELFANIVAQVAARRRTIGEHYPVKRDGLGFSTVGRWEKFLPYNFLLLVSLNQIYEELTYGAGTAGKPAEIFENLTAIALTNYAGCNAIRIGAPRRLPVPATFPAALDYTCEQLLEILGQRDLEDQNSGDDGLDVVAWRGFEDGRQSQLILLAQCAIGTDWARKRSELDMDVWRRHIDWHSTPIKVFAVPFHHEAGRPWRETATRGGIILDRPRIAKLASPKSLPAPLKANMLTWCKARLKSLERLTIE